MREIKQGTDDTVKVWLADDADHMTGKTGLVDGDITVEISKNGQAGFTDISAVTVTEAGYGWYNIPLLNASSHTDTLGDLVVRATATGVDSAERLVSVVANLESDTYTKVPSATINDYKADVSALEATVNGLNDFDPANDTVANVTTVATTTTNTDMRGTDSAALDSTVAKEVSIDDIKGTGFDTGQHNLKEIKNTIG